ncbi:(2Fe-2S)-binding protein [Porphyromonas pogonae]|uniref:(2Fe-2S)-binding protein n=1 Tax=Porphyromonas pogonae TaxID=867595 RepID=UPI002E7803A9|nr:(2Fe-2S)-binding protein [Porphyromonas pogonae]
MGQEDEIICHCNEITRGQIENAIREQGLKTIDEVGDAIDAGTVCGSCQDDIQSILDEING